MVSISTKDNGPLILSLSKVQLVHKLVFADRTSCESSRTSDIHTSALTITLLSLTFNGVAFLEEYQSVLRTIRFYDPSAEPVPGVVLIRYTVIAEEGQSETSTFNLTVVNVNDSPPLLVLSQT